MDRPRRGTRGRRVDEDGCVAALDRVDHPARLLLAGDDLDSGGDSLTEPLGHREPDAVVTAVGVPDPHDDAPTHADTSGARLRDESATEPRRRPGNPHCA